MGCDLLADFKYVKYCEFRIVMVQTVMAIWNSYPTLGSRTGDGRHDRVAQVQLHPQGRVLLLLCLDFVLVEFLFDTSNFKFVFPVLGCSAQ